MVAGSKIAKALEREGGSFPLLSYLKGDKNMVTYILRRTLMSLPILLGITILSFAIMKATPGDPMSLMMDPTISQADRAKFIEKYGLNDPEPVQYVKWLGNIVARGFRDFYRQERHSSF